MITGPFWRYYGGKWRAAPLYPQPRHKQIIEPFAGAAGYSLRYAHHDVLLIDASEKVCGVWDYLIHASAAEIRALPDLVRGVSVDDYAIPQEARWLLGFWCNEGAAQPCKSPSIWNADHGSNWNNAGRSRCARQAASIRHWRVMHGTYRDAPECEASWFVDPPYQGKPGSHYPNGSRDIDYTDLGLWCQDRQGQVTVCEGPDADWMPFEPLATTTATPGKTRAGKSAEVIWCSDGWAPPVQEMLL
jgi:hypothetical protein